MKPHRLFSSFLLAAVFALLLLAAARAEESSSTIKFTDPAKPGTVKIILARGEIRVQGTDTSEVTVKSDVKSAPRAPRKDGLRVITASTSFALGEKDNVVTLDAAAEGWVGGSADFRLTVPRNTSVIVQSSFGGGVTCTDIAGDIEIHSMNGKIRLDDVSGGIVVDTMNGEIRAGIRELHDNKPLSFTSMNGEVVLRIPADAKANVRLRTQNGSVLTDFEESALVTKTETAPRTMRGKMSFGPHPVLPPEAVEGIREATRIALQASREAVAAARQGIDDAREKTEIAREKAEAAREKAEADREKAEADRAAAKSPRGTSTSSSSSSSSASQDGNPPTGSTSQHSSIVSTISGGNLVTGTLNGGGPEISVATMNGDVTLRKLEKK